MSKVPEKVLAYLGRNGRIFSHEADAAKDLTEGALMDAARVAGASLKRDMHSRSYVVDQALLNIMSDLEVLVDAYREMKRDG